MDSADARVADTPHDEERPRGGLWRSDPIEDLFRNSLPWARGEGEPEDVVAEADASSGGKAKRRTERLDLFPVRLPERVADIRPLPSRPWVASRPIVGEFVVGELDVDRVRRRIDGEGRDDRIQEEARVQIRDERRRPSRFAMSVGGRTSSSPESRQTARNRLASMKASFSCLPCAMASVTTSTVRQTTRNRLAAAKASSASACLPCARAFVAASTIRQPNRKLDSRSRAHTSAPVSVSRTGVTDR